MSRTKHKRWSIRDGAASRARCPLFTEKKKKKQKSLFRYKTEKEKDSSVGRRCSPKLVFWLVEAVKWLPSNKHPLVMSKPEKKSSRPNVLNATPSTKVQVTSKVRTSIYFNFFLFHFVFYRLLVFALPVNLFFFFFFFGVCKFF